jgi:hypothetical protein
MLGRVLPVLVGLTVLIYCLRTYAVFPSIAKDGDLNIDFSLADDSFLKRSQQLFFPSSQSVATRPETDQKDAIVLAKLARIAPIPSKPYSMVMCRLTALSLGLALNERQAHEYGTKHAIWTNGSSIITS